MRTKIAFLSFILAASFTTAAKATIVTFEDIDSGAPSNGYGGISGWDFGSVRSSFGTELAKNYLAAMKAN